MFLPANITLKFGDSGDFVSELQRRLTAVHCFSGDPSGFYDGTTVNGVSSFQSMSGIRADGIAGPETLRRLNGVISGDTSSTNHDEEQNRLRQEEMARQIQMQEAQARQLQHEQERLAAEQLATERANQAQQWQQTQTPQQPEIQYAQEAAYAPQQHQPQVTQQQMIAAEAAQNMQMQHQMAHAQQQQPAAPVAVHHLAAQPVQVDAPQHQQAPQLQPPAPAHHAAPAPVAIHVITPQATAAASAAQAALAAQHQPAKAPAAEVTNPATDVAMAPKGIVGRAMQYANDMVQKLSAYFESKLPSPVIDEVKNIGMTMAKSGVKEAAIPTGPEPQRGIDTPARGPQQQQQQARG